MPILPQKKDPFSEERALTSISLCLSFLLSWVDDLSWCRMFQVRMALKYSGDNLTSHGVSTNSGNYT